MKFGLKRWLALIAGVLMSGGQVSAQQPMLHGNYDDTMSPAASSMVAPYGQDVGYGYQPVNYNDTGYADGTYPDGTYPQEGYADGGQACGNCGQCDACNPRRREWFPAVADHCPRYGIYTFSGFESWRGVSDGGGPNNNGIVGGLNVGLPVRPLSAFGLGMQMGISAGAFDLMGRPTNGANEANQAQSQYMITYGFFRRADCDRPFSFGVVQDWSVNNNFGTLSNEPTLNQWRAQLGYALNDSNEIGVWAAIRDRQYTQTIPGGLAAPATVTFRPINQTNFFWHHKWCYGGADSWLWLGFPSRGRLNAAQGGTIGEIVFGGMFNVPIGDRMALYSNVQYMRPSSNGGVAGSTEDFFDFGVGLAFYPGATARSRTVAGRSWMPLMPVANNGSFLVDRSL